MLSEQLRDLLLRYVEGEQLSHLEENQIGSELSTNIELQEEYQLLMKLAQSAETWADEPVPDWNRTRYISRNRQAVPWVSWLSLAASTLAILMVVLQVNIQSTDEGLYIAFGSAKQNDSKPIENSEIEFNKKLDSWKLQQARYIDNRLNEFEYDYSNKNRTLLNSAVRHVRQERQQENRKILNYLQYQRASDLQNVNRRYRNTGMMDWPLDQPGINLDENSSQMINVSQ